MTAMPSVTAASPTLVVVGLLTRGEGPDTRFLVARRPADAGHLPGAWELPGGKVEPGEAPAEALVRELSEELGLVGLSPADCRPLSFSHHVYAAEPRPDGTTRPARALLLLCFHVALADGHGEPRPLASDALAWLDREALLALPMPAANAALLWQLSDGFMHPCA
jgi:8-oxo-dGTP diphosphatase